jgi:hypothetical protein
MRRRMTMMMMMRRVLIWRMIMTLMLKMMPISAPLVGKAKRLASPNLRRRAACHIVAGINFA